jgi:ADP-heptose:LPS heptosyltransferase
MVMEKLKNYISILLGNIFSIIRVTTKILPFKTDSLAVIVLHKLGDSVFTIPAIKEITKAYKDVTLVCYPDTMPIYKEIFGNVNYLVIDPSEIIFNNRIAKSSARKKLKELKPGIIFDLTGSIRGASLIFNSRPKEIIGMNEPAFKNIYDIYSEPRSKPHLIDMYFDAVKKKLGIINLPNNKKEFKHIPNNNNIILIHPFAGWDAKIWDIEKFIELAHKLKAEYNIKFIVKKGELLPVPFDIVETNNTEDLIKHIKECSFFISNDSGPLYIANLIGKPTFTIYGPTNPEFSLPFGRHHGYIQKIISCSPEKGKQYCYTDAGRNGCPAYECMNQLTVNEVYKEIISFRVGI